MTASPSIHVRGLVQQLPDLDKVREVAETDDSPLTADELQQKDTTDAVIRSAQESGQAAIWVIGAALRIFAKGRFHRQSGLTYDEHVQQEYGISPAHSYRWRDGAPTALAIASATGKTPIEGQVRELRKGEKAHGERGRDLVLELARQAPAVAEQAGAKLTAKVYERAIAALPKPEEMPADPETVAKVVRESVLNVLTAPTTDGAAPGVSPIGETGNDGAEGEGNAEAPVRLSVTVPAAVADTLKQWAEKLNTGHRLELGQADVLTHVAELAAADEHAFSLISERIEQQHAEHWGREVQRFEWRPNPRSKTVLRAERRRKGHSAPKGHDEPLMCATQLAQANGETAACEGELVWKVEKIERTKASTAYYCAGHLPAGSTPPGVWN
ncbi:hypothetical protein [Streptomyces albireticuli]|nr:hypothetical protein [Streptomyces albireticuli]MCD9145886.1 hypothetical protein [Streptomyces albireticuli]MCD9166100.1 hypothetical protein [Streptomyces albireticuli]MCD9196380.1 hypothetical protein [Streptomyces albireticuli]